MKQKIRVGIIFGGKSGEHEISLLSARNVIAALNPDKYEAILIGIAKNGEWFYQKDAACMLDTLDPKLISLHHSSINAMIVPRSNQENLMLFNSQHSFKSLDVVFPVLHGPYGEDGCIQGLLKMADLPFVGAGVLGSAVAMDKDVMKRLLRDAGIPIANFVIVHRHQLASTTFAAIKDQLGLPFFIKPANLGSSVGISKVESANDFMGKLLHALSFDHKVIIEECIDGRELECSVLGNEQPIASLPGEIIPSHEFYSYEAKYVDPNGAKVEVPADLPPDIVASVQQLSIQAFGVLCCEGLARVDMFLTPEGKLLVNEINTMPGFTQISMYPKAWLASGLEYSELIDKLIELALERAERDKQLFTNFRSEVKSVTAGL